MATTTRMTSDQIAQLFANRLPAQGGYITVKQAAWLYNVWREEVERACPDARFSRHKVANGLLSDGTDWSMTIAPNGAGAMHLGRYSGR